jgi:hypothetical protein
MHLQGPVQALEPAQVPEVDAAAARMIRAMAITAARLRAK